MTTYSAGPGDAQSKINALLPGDILNLTNGSYSPLTVAVNGSLANEIKILGSTNKDGRYGSVISGGSPGLNITGSYIHVENLGFDSPTRGVIISNASHVKLRNVEMIHGVNEGVWIKNNSHHIFLWGWAVGSTDLPANNFTIAVRVGTPSAQWANVNTPDRTNNVHIFDGHSDWNPGWCVQVCEGAHHVLVEDAGFDSSSGPANRPPLGAANGDGGFNSQGDYVQFLRCFTVAPTRNYFRCDRVTVGGVTYGLHQEIKGGGGRPFGVTDPDNYDPNLYFEAVKSNTDDLKVYKNFFNVYQVVYPGHDDTGGTWAARGWEVGAELFKKMEIGGPARNYRLPNEVLPYGQYNPLVDVRWLLIGADDSAVTSPENTYGIEFCVDKPGGYVVGYAYFRQISAVDPSLFRLYRMNEVEDYLTWAPKSPEIGDFASYDEWSAAFTAWLDYYGQWFAHDPFLIEFYRRTPIVETTKAIPHKGTLVKQGWVYEYLDNPYPLIENFHYCAAFYFPPTTSPVPHIGHAMGLGFYDFWGRTYGANGFRQGPAIIPPWRMSGTIFNDPARSNFDNRPGNVATRDLQTTRSVAFKRPLPGEDISYPDSGTPIGNGFAYCPIISFARVIPEIITVTPDMDLQEILNTRIPGDTVIISGTHTGEFVVTQAGAEGKPIHLVGDGTAKLRYRFGSKSFLAALRVKVSYIWLDNIIFEQGRHGVLIENGAVSIRVEDCTARFVRDEGFVVQEDSKDVCFINCTTSDTGMGKVVGDGFRVGRHAGSWIQDGHPDATERVLIQDCTVTRAWGTGISACDGATQVVVKNCAVDFTAGNVPTAPGAGLYYDPPAGYYSRADQCQIIGCTVVGAPGAGFLMMDSQWRPNTTNYGRLIEVKGGSSTGHGDAGVVSQSEGLKVYADFTATPSPRVREIEGNWVAAGSNVAVTGFREMVWHSVAQHYPPNETE